MPIICSSLTRRRRIGCPPITDFAFQADQLESQLDAQTRMAINDSGFISFSGNNATISKIFQWYNTDFGGGKKDVLNYINQYRTAAIPTFHTTSISALYGINQRFNLGVDLKYRRTLNSGIPSGALDVFKGLDGPTGRTGITGIGPRIRWAPIPEWSGFSLQSTFTFAVGDNLAGTADQPFIDWDNNIFWTQFFYDKSIGTRFSFFAELDVLWEDIGGADRLTFPATVIFSYFPDKKLTLYTLAGYAPTLTPDFDYFHQLGLGTKYQVTRRFEIELLYTKFQTKFVKSQNGNAGTYNLGLRFTI